MRRLIDVPQSQRLIRAKYCAGYSRSSSILSRLRRFGPRLQLCIVTTTVVAHALVSVLSNVNSKTKQHLDVKHQPNGHNTQQLAFT